MSDFVLRNEISRIEGEQYNYDTCKYYMCGEDLKRIKKELLGSLPVNPDEEFYYTNTTLTKNDTFDIFEVENGHDANFLEKYDWLKIFKEVPVGILTAMDMCGFTSPQWIYYGPDHFACGIASYRAGYKE